VLDGLWSNLLAEAIGAVVTLFVLEEIVRRSQRRTDERRKAIEDERRLIDESAIWEELEVVFGESLEEMARVWTHFLPEDERPDHGPFFTPEFEEKILRGFSAPREKPLRPMSAVTSVGKVTGREADTLVSLRDMFPNKTRFITRFISLGTWTRSLEANHRYLERLIAPENGEPTDEHQDDVIKDPGKRLYFTRGAVLTHALKVLRITAEMHREVRATLKDAQAQLADVEIEDGQTWLESAVGLLGGPARRSRSRPQ
jgi:hypothetical protein